MAHIATTQRTAEFCEMASQAVGFGETNDCSVKAVALATGVAYAEAHAVLNKLGRKDKRGASTTSIIKAISECGKTATRVELEHFIHRYPGAHKNLRSVTTHHPERFNSVWKDGQTYVLFTARHVLAVVDGKNHDWTVGRSKRAISIWRIE